MSGPSIPAKLPAVGAILAAIGAIAAAPTENNAERPTGAYAYVPAKDAAGCAIACAQDNICLAWSFKATELVGCSLKAIVPPADSVEQQSESGVAPRAAQFLSLTTLRAPAAPASAPSTPPPTAEPIGAKPLAQIAPPAQRALALTSAPALASAPLLEADAPIEPSSALRVARAELPVPHHTLQLALAAPPAWLPPALSEETEIASGSWVSAAPMAHMPQTRAPYLADLALAGFDAFDAPQAHVFSPPNSFLHAVLVSHEFTRAAALPNLATLRFAIAAPIAEEEFLATAQPFRMALLAAPARPQLTSTPPLQPISLQTPAMIALESERPHMALTAAEPGAALSQMRLALQPVMIVASATTATARPYQAAAAPPQAAPPQPSAEEEDLLGGPDAP